MIVKRRVYLGQQLCLPPELHRESISWHASYVTVPFAA